MKRTGSDDSLRCSFCHKSQDVVGKLISSPSDYPRAYICDECAMLAVEMISIEHPDWRERLMRTLALLPTGAGEAS